MVDEPVDHGGGDVAAEHFARERCKWRWPTVESDPVALAV